MATSESQTGSGTRLESSSSQTGRSKHEAAWGSGYIADMPGYTALIQQMRRSIDRLEDSPFRTYRELSRWKFDARALTGDPENDPADILRWEAPAAYLVRENPFFDEDLWEEAAEHYAEAVSTVYMNTLQQIRFRLSEIEPRREYQRQEAPGID